MKFRNQFIKYMLPENDGADGSANAGLGDADQKGEQESEIKAPTLEEFKALQAEKADLLAESMKRKGKIKDLESESAARLEQLAKFEGVDVELYSQMVSERDKQILESKKAKEDLLLSEGKYEELMNSKVSEYEGILEQMRVKHGDELKTSGQKFADLEASNNALLSQIQELTVGSAFGNSKVIREDLISAMTPVRVRQLYGAHFEPNEKGEVIGYDKPKGQEGRSPIVDSQGKVVPFDEALKFILTKQGDIESMLKSKVNGSGSSTVAGDGRSQNGQTVGQGISRINAALNGDGK